MSKDLFRKEVFDERNSRYIGNVIITTPITYKVLVLMFFLIGCIILIFIYSGTFTKKVRVMGQILPENGLVRVYSSQRGLVENVFVRENSFVKKGDNLLEINNSIFSKNNDIYDSILSESISRKAMLGQEIDKTIAIHNDTISTLKNEVGKLSNEISNTNFLVFNLNSKIKLAQQSYMRYLTLYKESAASLEDLSIKENAYLDLKNQLKILQNDLMKLKVDLKSKKSEIEILENQQDNRISELRRQMSLMEQEKIQNEINSSQYIKSPIDGKISIVNIEKGQTSEVNKALITMIPKNENLICFLYIPSSSIGFIKKNSKVSIRYQAYPYQKFGLAQATITSISVSPIASSELNTLGNIPMESISNNEPIYIVKAKLDKQSITVYGREEVLKSGMLLDADIKLDTRKIYEWILEPLYSITGKL
ncbi:secretion protein HylD [Acinetobacter calcoaceticus]|nr:secretion protein HylD [Acinetobacter calcoaceticus]